MGWPWLQCTHFTCLRAQSYSLHSRACNATDRCNQAAQERKVKNLGEVSKTLFLSHRPHCLSGVTSRVRGRDEGSADWNCDISWGSDTGGVVTGGRLRRAVARSWSGKLALFWWQDGTRTRTRRVVSWWHRCCTEWQQAQWHYCLDSKGYPQTYAKSSFWKYEDMRVVQDGRRIRSLHVLVRSRSSSTKLWTGMALSPIWSTHDPKLLSPPTYQWWQGMEEVL